MHFWVALGRHIMNYITKKSSARLIIIILCLFTCAAFWFFTNRYILLSKQLKEEQGIYIDEIQHHLGENIATKERYQSLMLSQYLQLLNSTPLKHFQEVDSILLNSSAIEEATGDYTKMLFVSDKGKIFNSSGNQIILSNTSDIHNFLENPQHTSFSAQIDNKSNLWIFAAPLITPIQLDQNNIIGIMLASPTVLTRFEKNLEAYLFHDKGHLFVVNAEAEIIMAQKAHQHVTNFISFLQQRNITQDSIDKIYNDLTTLNINKRYLNIEYEKWMIAYRPIPNTQWMTVLMLPTESIGAQIYPILEETVIGFSIIVLCVLLLLSYIFYYFQYSSRKRDQEKNKNLIRIQLMQEAAKAKEDFFSRMSHDLRTPLQAMIGMNHLALENIYNPTLASEYLRKSEISEIYLLNILNDILDISKMENGKVIMKQKSFDFLELLKEIQAMIEPLAREHEITFAIKVEAQAITHLYIGDPLRIKQILINLLSNAMKFTSKAGTVELYVEIIPLSSDADKFIISICDNGIGMSEVFLEKIFEPFEQGDNENQQGYLLGSGLGLSIVKGLTEAMNGTVKVHSKLNKGTTFTITIPLKKISKQMPNHDTKLHLVGDNNLSFLKDKRVLLVEDNAMNVMILSNILTKKFNLCVDCAENGKIALQKFETHPIDYYCLILMDICMPIMNGYEATQAIRASKHTQAKSIPIIAMSGNAYEEDIQHALDCGINVHLSKPVHLRELENALLDLLT